MSARYQAVLEFREAHSMAQRGVPGLQEVLGHTWVIPGLESLASQVGGL